MDKYIDWIKTHKLLGAIVAIGVAIIAIGNLTDAVTKISSFVENLGNETVAQESLSIILKVKNKRSVSIEISPFVRYFLTEDKGAMIQEYNGGRLILKPIEVKNEKQPNIIKPNGTHGYFVILPDSLVNSLLLERGAGNMHINLEIIGEKETHLETFPLIKEAFEKYNLEYTISPNKAN